jgi:anti-sigma factor RsiW
VSRVLCAESLRVQAYFDDEVDAVSALEIERHLERCPECRDLQRHLLGTRTALRDLPYQHAPAALMERIGRELDREAVPDRQAQRQNLRPQVAGRRFWQGALSGIGVSALAAALALFAWLPSVPAPLVDDLMSAHLRSLMSNHMIDVQSSDHHTVKPWFAGHTDVSPAVTDFAAQGYKLIGGRVEYLDQQRAAVLVYQHGAHLIDVFAWAAGEGAGAPLRGPHRAVTRHGYQLLFWRQGDIAYCAVADTGQEELQALMRLMQSTAIQ